MNSKKLIWVLVCCLILSQITRAEKNSFEKISSASKKFCLNFFGEISSSYYGKNIISSSFNTFISLSMLHRGAEGKTADLLQRYLDLPENRMDIEDDLKNFILDFKKVKKTNLTISNKIFASDKLKIKDEFSKKIKEIFNADVAKININKPTDSVKIINDWVDLETNRNVKNLIRSDEVDHNTRVILINTFYFKGKWKRQLKKNDTRFMKFFKNKVSQTNVSTMYVKNIFLHCHLNEIQAQSIVLPYEDDDINMILIVPNEKDGLKDLEEKLKSFDYKKLKLNSVYKTIELYLPKFKIEGNVDLKGPMSKIGLDNLFSSPNFSGISSEILWISKFIQKAYIEVEESTTETLVTSGISVLSKSGYLPSSVNLHVDRPFYFFIEKSGIPIVQGHIYNP